MKKTLTDIWNFIHDNWILAVAAIVLALIFFNVHYFAELAYGAIRLTVVIIAAALVLHLTFKDTLRRYINEGQLVTDFHGLDAKHKVYVTAGIIAVLIIVSALCFVHA